MTAGADAQAAPCAPVRGGGGGVHCPKGGNREDYERLRSCARIALCTSVAHGLRGELTSCLVVALSVLHTCAGGTLRAASRCMQLCS